MKRLFVLLICFAFIFGVSAQETDIMLKGGVEQQNYFTVVPYTLVVGVPIIKVKISGKEYRFLFDTGAGTAISQMLLEELNPEVLAKRSIQDANGKIDTLEICKIDNITIGEVVFKDIPALILKESTLFNCLGIDGIVGSNQLRESIVRISDKEKTITITDMSEKLDLDDKQEHVMELFLEPHHNSPIIFTRIDDNQSLPLQVFFDSGMNGMLNLSLKHLDYMIENNVISGNLEKAEGSSVYGVYEKLDNFTQYRSLIPRFWISKGFYLQNVGFNSTSHPNARIGMKLLKYGDMTLDYKNKAYYYEPHTAEAPDAFERWWSISPIMDDGKMVVGIIWDKKLKKQIGIGDQIISFNGASLENLSECELFLYDFTPLKKEVNILEIKDKDGNIKEIEIKEE